MAGWNEGYIVDIEYTHGFYRELAPSLLSFAALMQGVSAPGLRVEPLAYCELGCGQGYSTNLLAAANPNIQFYANDFNPAQIAGARRATSGIHHRIRGSRWPSDSSLMLTAILRDGRRWRPRSHERSRSRARPKTSSSMPSVSLPVKVFCWLGW